MLEKGTCFSIVDWEDCLWAVICSRFDKELKIVCNTYLLIVICIWGLCNVDCPENIWTYINWEHATIHNCEDWNIYIYIYTSPNRRAHGLKQISRQRKQPLVSLAQVSGFPQWPPPIARSRSCYPGRSVSITDCTPFCLNRCFSDWNHDEQSTMIHQFSWDLCCCSSEVCYKPTSMAVQQDNWVNDMNLYVLLLERRRLLAGQGSFSLIHMVLLSTSFRYRLCSSPSEILSRPSRWTLPTSYQWY